MSAALPLEEPPALRVVSQGFSTSPVEAVIDAPAKQRSSHTALPAIVAPASSRRRTMVASVEGTNPSTVAEPLVIGTPATAVLSLIATVRPASGPSPPSVIEVVTYQALNGLSAGSGRLQERAGAVGAVAS